MNEAQEHLKKLIDLLGPGWWLELDDQAVGTVFKRRNLPNTAKEFAEKVGCVFLFRGSIKEGNAVYRFGRAYFQ